MRGFKVAERYAKAILQLAEEINKIDRLSSDFEIIDKTIKQSRDLQLFLQSPIINKEKKKKTIKALFGNEIDDATLKFFLLLVAKNRENIIPAIIFQFNKLLDEKKGIVNAEIATVVPFSKEQTEKLTKRLEAISKKKVRIKFNTDPSIIGGFKIKIKDNVWDGSIKHQFEILKEQFSKFK